MPAVVSAERAQTPKGRTTIVEFVDFECPFCRAMNDDLAPAIAAHRDRVRIVRKQVPLAGVHPHALDAARASVCADSLGRGDAMADFLFHAPPTAITEHGIRAIAPRLGLDPVRFAHCLEDPATLERIKADFHEFEAADGDGVPVVWIDDMKFEGEQSPDVMRAAVERAVDNAND